ncbi:hypothetical protein BGZ54_004222, partial [Gamsiella multidivaricata]
LLAASVCGGYSKDDENDNMPLGRGIIYYTYGLEELGKEIETFMGHLLSSRTVYEPSWILDCILQYPIRSTRSAIADLPQKSLLDYVGTALGFPPFPSRNHSDMTEMLSF